MLEFRNQKCPENGVIVDDEMVWAGGVYLEAVWARAWEHLPGLEVEAKVSLEQYIPGMRGRTDTLWRSADRTRLAVFDLKFGYGQKTGFENWQLISYALGAVDEYTRELELIVVQPRGASAGRPVKPWPLSIETFWGYARRLVDAANEARGNNPRTFAGGHCRYCKAGAGCPTLAAASDHAMDAGLAQVNVEQTEFELAHEIEQLDRATDLVRARLDALEALAIARIQSGKPVPGYAHKKSLGNRSWTLSPRSIVELGGMFGVDVETERKPLTPNKAEGRGLPREVIDKFTQRFEIAAKLTRINRNAAREVFR